MPILNYMTCKFGKRSFSLKRVLLYKINEHMNLGKHTWFRIRHNSLATTTLTQIVFGIARKTTQTYCVRSIYLRFRDIFFALI